jgi:Ran-binding protein 3
MTSIFGEVEHGSGDDGEADEEDRPQSFSEKLRAAKDDEYENKEDEEKLRLTEQDGVCPHYQLALFVDVSVVMTGEEEEETIHQVRGKLFSLQGNSWKERGMGVLKLNVKQEDGTGARLGMSFYARHVCLL